MPISSIKEMFVLPVPETALNITNAIAKMIDAITIIFIIGFAIPIISDSLVYTCRIKLGNSKQITDNTVEKPPAITAILLVNERTSFDFPSPIM